MAGFMPAIHVLLSVEPKTWMPGSVSAFTRVFAALCARITEPIQNGVMSPVLHSAENAD